MRLRLCVTWKPVPSAAKPSSQCEAPAPAAGETRNGTATADLQLCVADDAEFISVRVAQNHKVGIVGIGPVVDLGGAQLDESSDLLRLAVGVKVQMQADRFPGDGVRQLQRHRQMPAARVDQHLELRVPMRL